MNDRFVEDVKSRVDLVEIVRKYTEVKKSGKNFMCRSPFRNERTPSFSISSEKQMWYDFGASEGGDAISFIEKIENCSFREAVEMLADMAGVEIPKDFGEEKGPTKAFKQDIFSLHEAAVEYFEKSLSQDKKAQKYAHSRGLTNDILKDWHIGYGGNAKDGLTKYLLEKGFATDLISQSGVAFERSFGDKAMMDRFWGRLMIPIAEPRNGQIIAFSGRDILDREKVGKYVNSPENPVYHKSSTLFGLDRARNAIREQEAVILVEGNLDVVFAHARGFEQTVATCGTALTEDHLRILRRFTSNFYLAFDNDLAGKKATLKAVEMLLKMELNPFVISLEGVKDLGEFLSDPKNTDAMTQIVDSAPSALSFFLDRFSAKNLNGSIEGEKKFLDSFFYFLKLVERPVEVDEYLKQVAEKVGRSKSIIEAEFEKFSAKKIDYDKPKFVEETKVQFTREQNFMGFLCAYWDQLSAKIDDEVIELFQDENLQKALKSKLDGKDLDSPLKSDILAWQLWQENLFEEDPDSKTLVLSFDQYVSILKVEKLKAERLAAAKNIGV